MRSDDNVHWNNNQHRQCIRTDYRWHDNCCRVHTSDKNDYSMHNQNMLSVTRTWSFLCGDLDEVECCTVHPMNNHRTIHVHDMIDHDRTSDNCTCAYNFHMTYTTHNYYQDDDDEEEEDLVDLLLRLE
jgi:hypothetical protein